MVPLAYAPNPINRKVRPMVHQLLYNFYLHFRTSHGLTLCEFICTAFVMFTARIEANQTIGQSRMSSQATHLIKKVTNDTIISSIKFYISVDVTFFIKSHLQREISIPKVIFLTAYITFHSIKYKPNELKLVPPIIY